MPNRRKTNVDIEVLAKSPLVAEFMRRIIGEETDPLSHHVFAENLAKRAADAFDLHDNDGKVFARVLLDVAREIIATNGTHSRQCS